MNAKTFMQTAAVTSALLLSLGSLAACSASAAEEASANAVPEIAELVPDEIADKGTVLVANSGDTPPFGYMGEDGKTLEGIDPSLARALGEVMGLEVVFEQTTFDAIIPALQAGTVDMAMSSIGDTKEREEVVDFVTYYQNGTTILVESGNPKNLDPKNLCGARVAVTRGSIQQNTMLPEQGEECEANGKPAPSENAYPGGAESILALQSGQVDAVLGDIPGLVEAAGKNEGIEIAGPSFKNPNPGGVALPKGSELAPAIEAAITEIMENGTYEEILTEYDLMDIAIEAPEFNGALS